MILFDKKINYFRNQFNSILGEVYPKGPVSLKEPINYVLNGKGKRFRPILIFIVADMNSIPIEDIIYPAISIEILHNFTLIHDDIMDKDTLRHGKETVHKRWDESTAILSGDAMLAISLQMLLKNKLKDNNKLIKTYVNGLLSVCEGQAIDIEFEKNDDVSLDDYIHMIYLKTAYMIGLSAEIGGILSELNKKNLKLLKDFGKSIGLAYQVQDDLLELYSDSGKMKKSLDSDFTLNKKTFLWSSTSEENKEELESIISNYSRNKDTTLSNLRNFGYKYGIKDRADSFIKEKITYADSLINKLDGDVDFLKYFSSLIFHRTY